MYNSFSTHGLCKTDDLVLLRLTILKESIINMNDNRISKAIKLTQTGEFELAKREFVTLNNEQSDPWLSINIANCCIFLNQTQEAEDWLDRANNSPKISAEHLYIASKLYTNLFSFKKAVQAAIKACTKNPDNLDYYYEVITATHQARDYNESLNYCEKLLRKTPDDPWALAFKGRILSSKGNFIEAEQYFTESIRKAPHYSYPYSGLAKCKKFSSDDSTALQLINEGLKLPLQDNDRARLLFSKAKILNDIEEYDEAWITATEANEIKKNMGKFVPVEYKKFIDKIVSTYASVGNTASDNSKRHILVVGMPRSGTTLIEQIISQDSNIYPGGETPAIDDALYRELKSNDYLSKVSAASPNDFAAIANTYEQHFKNLHGFYGDRILDKVPSNYLHIGVFKQIFPHLKIINLKRNKLDVATSIYFENFSQMLNYANDFNHTLFVQEQYERLMEHWTSLYPDDILTIEYEEFVKDYENHVSKVCEFVGCELPGVGDQFVSSSNSVQTPSLWQVRQKINSNAVDRWRRYQAQIQDLIKSTS